jgi:hypothetical protein
MRLFKDDTLKKAFKNDKKLFVIIALLVTIIVTGTVFIIWQEDGQLKEHYNQQIVGLTTASSQYLVSNYRLYYSSPTVKYQTLLDDFLSKNTILQKFQISDTDGKIVFDSTDYKNGIETLSKLISHGKMNQHICIKMARYKQSLHLSLKTGDRINIPLFTHHPLAN